MHDLRTPLPLRSIADATAARYGVSAQDLYGPRQLARIALPRHVLCYLAAQHSRLNATAVGRLMRRHPTTITYGRDKIAAQVGVDARLRADVAAIRDALGVGEAGDA